MLQGEKVVLRPLRRTDLPYILKWFNDSDVIQYLSMYLPLTEMEEEEFFREAGTEENSDVQFQIDAIDNGTAVPIGGIGLDNRNIKDRNAEFGIVIGEKGYWSQGYGTEAAELIIRYGFEQLDLHRIHSWAFVFNERSLRMHRRLGFTEEGILREASFKNGRYYDHVVFGLLREEWQKIDNELQGEN
ncbi:MAG: GNAT family N-acetyltransferase [Dehalococcoidales bacterium]|nr:GNAT family N-acetyltransferase [Dehalococcoidales bacterium]